MIRKTCHMQVDVSIYLVLSWFDHRVKWAANASSRQMLSTFLITCKASTFLTLIVRLAVLMRTTSAQSWVWMLCSSTTFGCPISISTTPGQATAISSFKHGNFYNAKLFRTQGIHKRMFAEGCGCREKEKPPRWDVFWVEQLGPTLKSLEKFKF